MQLRYLRGVSTLALDRQKCNGCRTCLSVCPHEVLGFRQKRAWIRDIDGCMECGACARNCPEGALTVQAGVGCAAGIINGWLRGTEPTCDCSGKAACC
jgi:ferredoxin